jgi:hypothetical protein
MYFIRSFAAVVLLLVGITAVSLAQGTEGATDTTTTTTSGTAKTETTTTTATTTATETQKEKPAAATSYDIKKARVTAVDDVDKPERWFNRKDLPREVQLGDLVTVTVNDDGFKALAEKQVITLFINGQNAHLAPIDKATPNYVFRLDRNDKNKELLQRILEAPFEESSAAINLGVGFQEGNAATPIAVDETIKPPVEPLTLRKMDFGVAAWIWVLILIAVLIYFYHLAKTTDILRNGPAAGGQKQAYSLARTQMAVWFFVVIVSYVTIWMITGARDTVSDSAMILIGISGATALASVAIDATASTRVKAAIERLNAELTTLQAQRQAELTRVAPAVTSPLIVAIDNRIAAIRQEQTNIVTAPPSVSFLTDILTDDSGAVALHRFQIVLWTLVLSVIFLAGVLHVLSMPEFNSTLLALMGISSGTYLGFKMPTTG